MRTFGAALRTSLFVLCVIGSSVARSAGPDVLTYHNDVYRSGVSGAETVLRPANVNGKSFGRLFARRVIGQIWGQPLYVRGIRVRGAVRNVVYVATSENHVYGFDADNHATDENTAPLMHAFLGRPVAASAQFPTLGPSNGITSTPVIDLGASRDPGRGTLYVVAQLDQERPYHHPYHLFALDLPALAVRNDVVVSGQLTPRGGGSALDFSKEDHLNRPALLLSAGHLIIAFGSGPNNDYDAPHFHGWVVSYSVPDLAGPALFVTTPSQGMGGIWQAGSGPAADDEGSIYFMTGNGGFRETAGHQPDLSNAFVKLANINGQLQLADWYTPPSRDVLQRCDLDLGASGPAVLPGAQKVLGAGKSGILYVLDKNDMGRTDALLAGGGQWHGSPDCTRGQCFRVATNEYPWLGTSNQTCDMSGDIDGSTGFNSGQWHHVVMSYPHIHGPPVLWTLSQRDARLYVWPEQDFLRSYRFDGQKFATNPIASSSASARAALMSMPGGMLSLSWDGTNPQTGVVWASRPDPKAPLAAAPPTVSVFHDQQHFTFPDRIGRIWDAFYVRGSGPSGCWPHQDGGTWCFQQINTQGHAASGSIVVSIFGAADQQHFVYTDGAGKIWDSFYRRADGVWKFQEIQTQGHVPVGGPFVSAFHDQQHFVFRDAAGRIWDSFYRQGTDSWNVQEIPTHGHPTAGAVFVSVFDAADQQHFAYVDVAGKVWDSFFRRSDNTWQFQQIAAQGHVPVGSIFVSVFHDQQHFVFRDAGGLIWDSFYVRSQNSWHFQQIQTHGHAAGGPVTVSVFANADQQHFAYADAGGAIWDSFYRRNDNSWQFQAITGSGQTSAEIVAVSDFYDQQHFVYRNPRGDLWDTFYQPQSPSWQTQLVTGCLYARSSDARQDLAPDTATCNAIRQIVSGYLEAFSAMPDAQGQLRELWNSENDPTDRVQWFAKDSPPTVADGKVFLSEFPKPVEAGDWSAPGSAGRLLVYGVR